MRKTILIVIAIATILAVGLASPASADERRHRDCVDLRAARASSICTTTALRHPGAWKIRATNLVAVGDDTTATRCGSYEQPNNAYMKYYKVLGTNRAGRVTQVAKSAADFNLDHCSNVDRHNYRITSPCLLIGFGGKARLDQDTDKLFQLWHIFGRGCSGPPDDAWTRVR